MMKDTTKVVLWAVVMLLSLSACTLSGANGQENAITASGTISADDTAIASELGGVAAEVVVQEGDTVAVGDVLFRVDDAVLQAQLRQADAAVEVAEKTLAASRAQLQNAQIQYDLALQGARLQDREQRMANWWVESPDAFELPGWYFEKADEIAALEAEIESAQEGLEQEQANLYGVLSDASREEFIASEKRLAEARARFETMESTLEQARSAQDNEALEDVAEEALDAARAELEAAQEEYDRLLSTSAAEDVLEARAQVAFAQARLHNAQDRLDLLHGGAESLQVAAAEAVMKQAALAVEQAQANLTQAIAARELVQVQLQKATVSTPVEGVVLSLDLGVGEVVAQGETVVVLGRLDEVELTVYIPEDVYGRIRLGQDVEVRVDSYSERQFTGQVMHISDEAEFTPRNVQTIEGRKSTVYAVDILVANPGHELKPGMPADVTFEAET